MSRTCSKEVFTQIFAEEIEGHRLLLDKAAPKIPEALESGKLSAKASEAFGVSQDMLKAATAALDDENFEKTLHFLVRSVANYYLVLGDKGVLKEENKNG